MRWRGRLVLAGLCAVVVAVAWIATRAESPKNPGNPSEVRPTELPALLRGSRVDKGRFHVWVTGVAGGETAPLEDVTVVVRRKGEADDQALVLATDADGIASQAISEAADFMIAVRHAGYLGEATVHRLEPGGVAIVRLNALAAIDGTVRSSEGSPVEHAVVQVMVPAEANKTLSLIAPSDRDPTRSKRAKTGEGGHFLMDVIPPDTPLTLFVAHETLGRRTIEFEDGLPPGDVRSVDVVLEPPTNVVGRSPSQPGGRVECWHLSDGGLGLTGEQRVAVGDDGLWSIVNVASGPKLLTYSRLVEDELTLAFRHVDAVRGEVTDIGALTPDSSARSVSILVSPEGRAPGAIVDLEIKAVQIGEESRRAFTHVLKWKPGTPLVVHGMPAGQLLVVANLLDPVTRKFDRTFVGGHARIPEGSDAQEVNVVVRRRAPTSKGVLEVSLQPPDGVHKDQVDARVVLFNGDRLVKSYPREWIGGTVFKFSELPPEDDYSLLAIANGRVCTFGPVKVADDRTTTVRLETWVSAPSVGIAVTAKDRSPSSKCRVVIQAMDVNGGLTDVAEFGLVDGRTSIVMPQALSDLAGCRVFAACDGLFSSAVPVRSAPSRIDLVLEHALAPR